MKLGSIPTFSIIKVLAVAIMAMGVAWLPSGFDSSNDPNTENADAPAKAKATLLNYALSPEKNKALKRYETL